MVYRIKRSVPCRTKPRETLQERGRSCKERLEASTEKDLEDRYDWNQSSAVPEMPKHRRMSTKEEAVIGIRLGAAERLNEMEAGYLLMAASDKFSVE